MAKPVSIPNSFATSTAAIPLSYLDQDFNALANSTNDLATYSNYVADTGAANAYIANFPTNTNTSSLTAGLRVQFKAANANTGASTLNVQVNSVSIGSGSIVLTDGSALSANSIVANAVVDVIYDGSNFQLINDASGASETISNLTVTNDATIGGNLTVDTNTLYVDAANNRVGIGTSSPSTKLDVSGTLNTSGVVNINGSGGTNTLNLWGTNGVGIRIGNTTSGNSAFIVSDSGDNVTMNVGGTGYYTWINGGSEKMRIDSSGNVGIGTTSPSTYGKFAVVADTNGNLLTGVYNLNTGASTNSYIQISAGGRYTNLSANYAGQWFQNSGINLTIIYQDYDTQIFRSNAGTERMRITSTGDVGIGTSSPTVRLDVTSAASTVAKFTYSTVSSVIYNSTGSGTSYWGDPTVENSFAVNAGSKYVSAWTNNAERMRIDSSGNVVIGSTSTNQKLRVYGSAGLSVEPSADNEANGVGVCIAGDTLNANGQATGRLYMTGNNAAHAGSLILKSGSVVDSTIKIYSIGNVQSVTIGASTMSHTGVYNTTVGGTNRDVYVDSTGLIGYVSSTRASKINIQSIEDISWLYSLQPVTFNRRKKEIIIDEYNQEKTGNYIDEFYNEKEFGLIAEDVEQINSDLCFYEDNKELAGVSYSKLITPMLKAIQEQQDIIKALETRIQALENK